MNNLTQMSEAGDAVNSVLNQASGTESFSTYVAPEYQNMVTEFTKLAHDDCNTLKVFDSQQIDIGSEVMKVLQKLKRSLETWTTLLYFKNTIDGTRYLSRHDPLKDLKKNVIAATVDDPSQGLINTLDLVKAHTTEIGNILSSLGKEGQELLMFHKVSEMSLSFSLLVSILAQVPLEDISYVFCDELKLFAHNLMLAANQFTNDLETVFELDVFGKQNINKGADICPILKSLNNLQDSCMSFRQLIEDGRIAFVTKMSEKLSAYFKFEIEMILYYVEEDPTRNIRNVEFTKIPLTDMKDLHGKWCWSQDPQLLNQYATLALWKINLIEDIPKAFRERFSTKWKGRNLDAIYRDQNRITKGMICVLHKALIQGYLSFIADEEALYVDKVCLRLVAFLRTKNADSPVAKWWNAWESEYRKLLEEMDKYFFLERHYIAWQDRENEALYNLMDDQST